MIVLDASVLIAHLEASDVYHRRATDLLLATVDEPLAASPLTLAEVLEVWAVPLRDDAPPRLATLRATYRLRLPDCWVLLAAESACASVATFDERLMDAARQLGLVIHH